MSELRDGWRAQMRAAVAVHGSAVRDLCHAERHEKYTWEQVENLLEEHDQWVEQVLRGVKEKTDE